MQDTLYSVKNSAAVTSPSRVLIAAFQGWSDAGDATTEALRHLIDLQGAEAIHVIGGEGFVDLQLQRPRVVRDEHGRRMLEWPDTQLFGTVHRPGDADADPGRETITRIDGAPVHDLLFLSGVEPSRDWENFADEIVELAEVWGVDLVIILGALYSDAPHSRPIITSVTSEHAELRERFGAERSEYEGAAGITSALDIALEAAGIGTVSLWAQVPHYVHSAPSPKATLAILDKLEELLDIVIPRGELFAQATEWENNINRIAANDDDMTRYIRTLEEARDEALAAETTGDALALEFEKFLKRDAEDGTRGKGARDDTHRGDTARDLGDTARDLGGSEGEHGEPGRPGSGDDSRPTI